MAIQTTIEVLRIPGTLFPRGPFDENADYKFLNFVESGGNGYVCLQPCTGIPVTNTAYWFKFVFRGEKGEAFTYADLTAEQKAELVRDATAAAQAAATSAQSAADDAAAALQKFNTIKAAIDAIDPTSTEGSIQTLAAKQGVLEAELDALGPKIERVLLDGELEYSNGILTNSGHLLYEDGSLSSSGYKTSDFIKVKEGYKIVLTTMVSSSSNCVLAAYSGSSYTYVKASSVTGESTSSVIEYEYTVPSGVDYIRVSCHPSYLDDFSLIFCNDYKDATDAINTRIDGMSDLLTSHGEQIADLPISMQTQMPSAPLVLTAGAIFSTTWLFSNNGVYHYHWAIPVNGGETLKIEQSADNAYCEFLTAYTKPIDGATPSYCSGYSGRQTLAKTSMPISLPSDCKFLIVNNPQNASYTPTKLEISGINILSGALGAALSIVPLIPNVQGVIRNNDLTVEVVSTNLANPSNIIDGTYISNTGTINSNADWSLIAFPVTAGKTYTFGGFHLGRNGYYAFYNGTTIIGSGVQFNDPNGDNSPITVTAPENATLLYIDIKTGSSPSNPYAYLMINEGSTLLPYNKYKTAITKISGYDIYGVGEGSSSNESLIADLPVSDGTGISSGYAYIDSTSYTVKVKQ